MADTTISVSKKFHDWLKGKGSKGESYEDIIKKVIKADFPSESGSKETARSTAADSQKPKTAPKDIKKAADDSSRKATIKEKPGPKNTKTSAKDKKAGSKPANASKELKQWRYEKNLELQRMETELELAKLSNDAAKAKELSSSIAQLKYQLEQRK
ncbi:hypothetical protein HYW20_00065 [Candidatus Woesearchaeota archaeon]|nr:hypothetical protein [Candidatus Woesearchaeota archaeon]